MKVKPARYSKTILADLMLPGDANVHHYVFGGRVLQLIDKAAYVAACRHARTPNCVTLSMEKVTFKVPINVGELVILEAQVNFTGKTSLEISVEVYAENMASGERRHANSCLVYMVAVDAKGRPTPVPRIIPETQEEKRRYQEAQKRREERLKVKT